MSRVQAAIAIDLGGTNLKGCAITREGKVLHRKVTPSGVAGGMPVVEQKILQLIDSMRSSTLVSDYEMVGGGICFPGVYNPDTRLIEGTCPNVPGLVGYPLVANIEKATGLRTVGRNDAKDITVGEYRFGAGRGADKMIDICLGTGIGGGVIIAGRLYTGSTELGHVSIRYDGRLCRCSSIGCIEEYGSARGFIRTFRELRAKGIKTHYPRGSREDVKNIFAYAKQADPLCLAAVKTTSRHLGSHAADVIRQWSPDIFVYSGQISRDGDFFIPFVREEVERQLNKSQPELLKVKIAAGLFPAEAGCMGAACNVFDTIDGVDQ